MFILNKIHNTYPIVVHANGNSKRGGWAGEMLMELDSLPKRGAKEVEKNFLDVAVVTWKGGKYSHVDTPIERSLRHLDFQPLVLQWPNNIKNFWEASKFKIFQILEALNSGRITQRYLIACDAGDVYFLRHPSYVVKAFLENFPGKKSVWCAEKNDWPHTRLPTYIASKELDKLISDVSEFDGGRKGLHGSDYAYLNAGCVVGETLSMRDFYSAAAHYGSEYFTNDQAMSRIVRHKYNESHAIDYYCTIFQTLWGVNSDELQFNKK